MSAFAATGARRPYAEVRLDPWEVFEAAMIGVGRQCRAMADGKRDSHGFRGDPWGAHILGALGEQAFAKVLNRYYAGSVDYRAGDVGSVEVRTAPNHDYGLLVRAKDPDHAVFVLVTGSAPTFRIQGWITGAEAKRIGTLDRPDPARPPCWIVRQEDLEPIEALG